MSLFDATRTQEKKKKPISKENIYLTVQGEISGSNYAKRNFFHICTRNTANFMQDKFENQNTKDVYPYKYVLTYPGKGEISVNCPNNSKCYAEWRNSQCKIGYSSQERYFNECFCSMFEPPGKNIVHSVPNSKKNI